MKIILKLAALISAGAILYGIAYLCHERFYYGYYKRQIYKLRSQRNVNALIDFFFEKRMFLWSWMRGGLRADVVEVLGELIIKAQDVSEHNIARLISALRGEYHDIYRSHALGVMEAIKDSRTVEPLIDFITAEISSEFVVRDLVERAQRLLSKIHDSRGLIFLIHKFGEVLDEVLEEPHTIEALIAASRDENLEVRSHAVDILGKVRSPLAVQALIDKLLDGTEKDYDGKYSLRFSAAYALGEKLRHARKGDPWIEAIVDPLIKALEDKEFSGRWKAAGVLGMMGGHRVAVDPLIKALEDGDPKVRREAAKALGGIRDPQAVDALIKTLEDRDPGVRREAAEGLGKTKDHRAVQPLIAQLIPALSDWNLEIPRSLVEILNPHDVDAIEPLIIALERSRVGFQGFGLYWYADAIELPPSTKYRASIRQALRKVTGENIRGKNDVDTDRMWRDWWEKRREGENKQEAKPCKISEMPTVHETTQNRENKEEGKPRGSQVIFVDCKKCGTRFPATYKKCPSCA